MTIDREPDESAGDSLGRGARVPQLPCGCAIEIALVHDPSMSREEDTRDGLEVAPLNSLRHVVESARGKAFLSRVAQWQIVRHVLTEEGYYGQKDEGGESRDGLDPSANH